MGTPRALRRWLAGAVLGGCAAFGGPAAAQDQAPGVRYEVLADDMPASPSASATNPPRLIARPADARPMVPPGFAANLFAAGLDHARWMAVAENGDVFLAEPGAGKITLLRDADGDGAAEFRTTFAAGLDRPHGLAIEGGYLYVGTPRRILRFAYRIGQERADSPPQAVTAEGALGNGQGHSTRNIAFSDDGSNLFIAVGSRANSAIEAAPRATVQELAAGERTLATFATGLRNPVGIAVHPATAELYVVVNERDGLGDGLVPDYLTHLARGGFYGWPYAYIGANPDQVFGKARPDLVERTLVPDVLFQSHSAPLGLVFYDAEQFPAAYRGDAFVALHGSWNAAAPVGYMVVRVPFEDGRPAGHYQSFATGFWAAGEHTALVWGRPAGLAVAADGSLLIADDVGQVIWRVSYAR